MALPVNAIIEATIEGSLNLQRIMSVFHYAVLTPSSTGNVGTEVTDFLQAWAQGGAGSFFTDYLGCMPSNYASNFAIAQAVHPIRYIRQRIGKPGVGVHGTAVTSNLQASITVQTQLAGRKFVGGKRLPIAPSNVSNGLIDSTIKAAFDNFTVDILANVTVPTGGGVYYPCLWHRPPDTTPPTTLVRAFTQPEARVMRRRTVGLGI